MTRVKSLLGEFVLGEWMFVQLTLWKKSQHHPPTSLGALFPLMLQLNMEQEHASFTAPHCAARRQGLTLNSFREPIGAALCTASICHLVDWRRLRGTLGYVHRAPLAVQHLYCKLSGLQKLSIFIWCFFYQDNIPRILFPRWFEYVYEAIMIFVNTVNFT